MSGYKRPESVLVLVCTSQNDVLLLERTEPSGFWQSVTGSLHWGEGAMDAARRELYEETGLMVGRSLRNLCHSERFPIVPPWRRRYAPHVRFNKEYWFIVRLPGRRLVRLNPAEHRRYRWVSAERAARLAFSWTNSKAIRRFCH